MGCPVGIVFREALPLQCHLRTEMTRSRGSCGATRRPRGGGVEYRATTAQWHPDRRASRPKVAKLAANDALRKYVQDRLGLGHDPAGPAVSGPEVRWIGGRHGRRKDRRWASGWSPEQIANRLRVDLPEDESMRISHEAIHQALYVQGRSALRRELTVCLRTARALRVPGARTRGEASWVGQDRVGAAWIGGRAARAQFAQQTRSNSALRTRTSHHTPALPLWCNTLLREGLWWALWRGSLDGMQGSGVQIPSAPPGTTQLPLSL
jgi:hypothetical protein